MRVQINLSDSQYNRLMERMPLHRLPNKEDIESLLSEWDSMQVEEELEKFKGHIVDIQKNKLKICSLKKA